MLNPTFDADGYPTDETLDYIKTWADYAHPHEFMEFIRQCWSYQDRFVAYDRPKHVTYYLSTGGWSGNESVIYAMQENFAAWYYWQQSKRGGHYWFRIPKKESTNED